MNTTEQEIQNEGRTLLAVYDGILFEVRDLCVNRTWRFDIIFSDMDY